MRYFTTKNNFLYWIWDEAKQELFYSTYADEPLENWNSCKEDGELDHNHPDFINWSDLGDIPPDSVFYAFETDENWNRL